MIDTALQIDAEFKALIPPLAPEEYAQLEANLLDEGCRDSLVVWNGVLVDGHNRYEICTKHDIEFDTVELYRDTRDAVKAWIIQNQFGRRNLQPFVRAELALELEPLLSKGQGVGGGGDRKSEEYKNSLPSMLTEVNALPQNRDTRQILSSISGISTGNITKVKKISEKADEATKAKLRTGETTINAEYQKITRQERKDERRIAPPPELPTGVYDVIYADPPWEYQFVSDNSDAIENHYPTMNLQAICDMKVPASDNCLLLMWTTAPKLEEAFKVINAWGFTYKTNAVWDKETIGMGYWFRGQHEHLLVATKGNFNTPHPQDRTPSVYREKKGKHSKKPEYFYELIESQYPNRKYIELFARNTRTGWASFGNQIND
jgi:N6-adenosine-specific RNA methylase IME4